MDETPDNWLSLGSSVPTQSLVQISGTTSKMTYQNSDAKKKILVVDNSPVIIKLMTTFLSQEGHTVESAEDAFGALDVLRESLLISYILT